MLLPDFEHGRLTAAAEHILVALAQPFGVGGITLNPSVSIGISVFPENGRDMDTLLRHADMAMYQAKTAGRNRISFFSAEMNRQAQERLALEAALRDALEGRALRLHYQPQVGLRNGSLYGVEALARWRHPTLGEISPARRAAGRGVRADRRPGRLGAARGLLAAGDLASQRPAGAFGVGEPVGHQLPQSEPARMIAATLAEFGLAPGDLMLEITEGVVLDATAGTLRTIAELHRLGVRLSMDDFGTGYSSLGHLRRLIVDELKLDRSFVQGLESDDAARALTSAVIRIGEPARRGRGDRERRAAALPDRAGLRGGAGLPVFAALAGQRPGAVAARSVLAAVERKGGPGPALVPFARQPRGAGPGALHAFPTGCRSRQFVPI